MTPTTTARPERRNQLPARQILHHRHLTIVGEHRDVFDLVNVEHGGVVLTSLDAFKDRRKISESHPDTVILLEPRALGAKNATVEQPLIVIGDDDNAFIDIPLDDHLDAMSAVSDVAIIPTGFLQAGHRKVLEAIILAANKLERDDVMLVIVADPRWLLGKELRKFIFWVKQSNHPVGIAFASTKENPLSTVEHHRGYRRLFAETGAFAWRTDHAGLDAIAHGAMGAAIGALPSLRKAMPPSSHGYSPDDKRPQLAEPNLCRYSRTGELERIYTNRDVPCWCIVCGGRQIARFTDSDSDKQGGIRHNVVTIDERFVAVLRAEDQPAEWRKQRIDAIAAHQRLIDSGVSLKIESGLRHWQMLDEEQPVDAPNPSEETPL